MIISTFNVNSVRLRLPNLLAWLGTRSPDVVCLQELKCQTEQFPKSELEDAGYNVAVLGQKGFNGVAILSKTPLEDVTYGLGDDDPQSRYIEAFTNGFRVASIYLPNGNPVDSEKYPYKLEFISRLKARAALLLSYEEPLVLAGDYNVIPRAEDCYDPPAWAEDALFRLETRQAFRALKGLGLTDALEVTLAGGNNYTFYDYQAGAFQKGNGIRIDHLLCSPQATDRLIETGINTDERGKAKPSDHVPVWAAFR
jgi:exodeoxyribonuclease III